jgi:hypothetical protein
MLLAGANSALPAGSGDGARVANSGQIAGYIERYRTHSRLSFKPP